jgi:type IV pilus assembly protein PilF
MLCSAQKMKQTVCLVALLLMPLAVAADRKLAEIKISLATEYLKYNQLDFALKSAEEAIKADSSYATAHMIKGMIYSQANLPKDANDSFQRALRIDAKDGDINTQYGHFLCNDEAQQEKALMYLDNAIKNPFYNNRIGALLEKGLCLERLARYDESVEILLLVLQQNPNFSSALYAMTSIHIDLNQLRVAENYYQRYSKTITKSTPEHLWLSMRLAKAFRNDDDLKRLGNELENRFPDSQENLRWLRGELYQ